MQVIFERVDGRRYRIGVVRDGRYDVGPDVPMRSGPGGSAVPHDLVHFVVEEQAGLRLGIFGQVAAGGDCNGFFAPAPGDRRRAQDAKRARRLGRAGRDDVTRSEQLAALSRAGRIPDDAHLPGLDAALREAVNSRLADVLDRWRATPGGRRLVLTWPDELTVRHGRIPPP